MRPCGHRLRVCLPPLASTKYSHSTTSTSSVLRLYSTHSIFYVLRFAAAPAEEDDDEDAEALALAFADYLATERRTADLETVDALIAHIVGSANGTTTVSHTQATQCVQMARANWASLQFDGSNEQLILAAAEIYRGMKEAAERTLPGSEHKKNQWFVNRRRRP